MTTLTLAEANYRALVAEHWAKGPPDGAHDLGHLTRVWANARRIAAEEGGDLGVLLAAAYFHDYVNLPKSAPNRDQASRLSAIAARRVLAETGLGADRLDGICHAIEAHSFSANLPATTLEARILQDADRLEALGAIGIARCFAVSGQMGGGLFDQNDPMAQSRALDDHAFALDHFEVKLLRLPATMQTATGRAMATERADWMMSFRTRLLAEAGA
jgi:uncharacterized protein